jgi:hydroxymethylpyrimidine/phosphomethylpyrimidine kinase
MPVLPDGCKQSLKSKRRKLYSVPMATHSTMTVALTVAGSDSGGGAGIQADLKTFRACGVFGTSAITCITAQNPRRVSAVHPVPPAIVAEQMERVLEVFPVCAAKTGMLYDAAIIKAVSRSFRQRRFQNLVVDPVMVSTSGATLLKPTAIKALTTQLFPLATVVTPNLAEAEILGQRRICCVDDLRTTALALAGQYGVPFLIKGGHLPGSTRAVDVLATRTTLHEFSAPVVRGVQPHGAGCTFSAAIAAHLARGETLTGAIRAAKRFITGAIRHSVRLGRLQALKV